MTETLIESEHIVTQCDQCGKWDDHPKVHTFAGLTRHHDCLDYHTKLEILQGAHSQSALITAKIFSECEKGLRGDELRAFIFEQHPRDFGDATMMASTGMDQAMANAIATALTPTSGTATIGTVTITYPIKCRFDSVITTSGASASTEWSGGSYPSGGVSIAANWAAASGGSRATSAAVTVSGAPATTWQGNELWDSSGTPLRSWYGAITGGQKTVNSGDTCTISSGQLTAALSI